MPLSFNYRFLFLLVAITVFSIGPTVFGQEKESPFWWGETVSTQLLLAGHNSTELEDSLLRTPLDHRNAMSFLIANLNPNDLETANGKLLLSNIKLAYEAKATLPWGKDIPEDIFLNDVLPYFNVDEKRESWRPQMYELCRPMIADCKTPAEAAQILNEQLFKKIGVKYSTARKQANQSPSESIEQGLASCTGLSILLADACRSVCVPARLSGIPSWPHKQGNHTWVEVWDGDWYFTGAAEPNERGLNHAWFQNDAARADKSSRLHAVYAVSFKKTDTTFPLVWSKDSENPVFAVNVTDRYTESTKAKSQPDPTGLVSTSFRIWNSDRTTRVETNIIVCDPDDRRTNCYGKTRNHDADMNDMLSFDLKMNAEYIVYVDDDGKLRKYSFKTVDQPHQLVEILFGESGLESVSPETIVAITADDFFRRDEAGRLKMEFTEAAMQAYAEHAQVMRQVVWKSYLNSQMARSFQEDYKKNQVQFEQHLSPYTVKEVGKRPKNGWPLFIAMHGGGGAPARVNDSQWKHMQIYYKNQTEVTGYKYLALRAPNNTWNGFYDDYVYPLIENLIRQFIVFGDIDPNKVFIMGYSHGGYGAFAIGPKIPYRFAAIHSSAAAPTAGETSAKTLRNTRFTFMVGENDNAYGRRERCEAFSKQIDELKDGRADIYPVEFLFKPGFGHGGLPDRDMIAQMYGHTRNAVPRHLTWELTDSVVNRFFWLQLKTPGKDKEIDASINDNVFDIQTKNVDQLWIQFDERLINPKETLKIRCGEVTTETEYKPSLKTLCRSIADTGDLNLAFDGEVEINP